VARSTGFARYLPPRETSLQTYEPRQGSATIYFMVMELISTGRNLREVLRHCGTTTGPDMPVQIAPQHPQSGLRRPSITPTTCPTRTGQAALQIIHRDVSPSKRESSPRAAFVKLIDFGIAKALGPGQWQTIGGNAQGQVSPTWAPRVHRRADRRNAPICVRGSGVDPRTSCSPNRPLFAGPRRHRHADPCTRHEHRSTVEAKPAGAAGDRRCS